MYPNIHHKHTSSGSRSHFDHSYSKPNVGQHYEKSDIDHTSSFRGVKWPSLFSLKMSGTLVWAMGGTGGWPPENGFNLEINLVQSGAPQKTF